MKKVLITVTATIFIFLLSGITNYGFSEGWIERKVVDKTFDISSNARLVVDHEFGEVRCSNWNKNEIHVVATVRVNTDNDSKAQKIIDKVIVNVKGSNSKVETECSLNSKGGKDKDFKISIDLDIMMPKSVSVEMENNFGVIYIEAVEGSAVVSCEYGTLEIGSLLNKENAIDVEFGSAKIRNVNACEVEASYSKLSIGDANNMSIESDYSDVEINSVNELSIEVDGGQLSIDEVDYIELEANMSDIKIGVLSEAISAEVEYGSLEIGLIDKGFKSVEMDNSYGSVNLNFSKDVSYNLQAQSVYGSVNYPENNAEIKVHKHDNGNLVISAIVGSDSNPKSKVIIETEYGAFNLKTK